MTPPPEEAVTPPTEDGAVFVHRFRSGGNKADSERCMCGAITWAEAIVYWRTAPTWKVLRRNVMWCSA